MTATELLRLTSLSEEAILGMNSMGCQVGKTETALISLVIQHLFQRDKIQNDRFFNSLLNKVQAY